MGNSIYPARPLDDGTPMSVGGNSRLQQLEAVYQRHGNRIYTLLRRLLADEKAAESATASVFVRFSGELTSQADEAQAFLRLRELAVETAVRRTKGRDMAAVLHWLSKRAGSLCRRSAAK
jgi:hypothetical protein